MARAKQSRPQPKKKKLQFPSGGSEQEETGGDDPSRSAAPRLGGRRAAPATAHGFLGSILGEAEAAAQQRVKKPHRFKPGTLRKYQKSTELLIPFTPFVRLVKELTEKSSTTVKRWTPPALVVLQEAAKYKLVDLLETANLCGIDAKRVGAEMFEPWNFKAQSEAHNPTDEEPGGQRKKLKRNETSNLEPKEHMPRLPSPSSCNPRAVESETSSTTAVPRRNPRVPGGNISAGQKSTQHARNNNKKSSRHVEDGTRTYRCEVKGCRSTFPGRSRLERHSRDVHRKGKLYKESELIMCSSCDKTFTRTEYLNNHVKRMHKPTPTFSCRLEGCTKIFDQHARKIHERSSQHFDGRTKKFKCTFKGCLFQTPLISSHNGHYMRFHKRGHEPTWTCRLEGCITELFDRHARMIHEKSSQHFDGRTKKFKCTFKGCMYQTPFLSNLKRHYTSSHKSLGGQER